MNRSTEPDFDQRIADWLEDDSNLAPRQALETVLAAYPSIPQRRTLRAPRRFSTMTMPIRLATAAVIGVLVVGGAYYLTRPGLPSVGGPGPTPSGSPLASQTVSAWTLTGAPALDRGNSGVTVQLQDGRVLVAGGRSGTPNKTAEIFDPGTGTWTATGSLHDGRSYPVVVRLADGRVLIAGGDDGNNNLDSAEIFDPATGTWTETGRMTEPRNQAFAAVLSDGKVLVAGRGAEDGNHPTAELFDPAIGQWTATGDMTAGRAGPLSATLLLDGRVLVTGGFTNDKRSAEVYDPTTGTWTAVGEMHAERVDEQSSVRLADGRVLAVGGRPTAGDLFDPATGTWTATGPMTGSTTDLVVSVLLPDGTVFVAGGGANSTVERFDPITGLWSAGAPMTDGRLVRFASLMPDGRVLVVTSSTADPGGQLKGELYDPTAGN